MSVREPWDTGPAAPQRPPATGQPLRPRVGTYNTFLQGMLARIPLQKVKVDGVPARPLKGLDPGTSSDFAAALLDAWAVVGDVLTFYQARILDEGYLRTAIEPRSRSELIAQLGFPLQPGISASTMLAFNVGRAAGATGAIRVPRGTAVQSIPGTNEQPQTFETSHDLLAQPAWNALAPAPVTSVVMQTLAVGGTQARLAGTGTGLAVGAPLLAASGDGSAWSFGTVTSVEPDAHARETRVTWSTAPAGERGSGTMADAAVWAFGRSTRLFGYNAAQWSSLGTEQKRAFREILGGVFVLAGGAWVGASNGLPGAGNGLPAADVRALAVDEAGRLYAGTAGRGLYVSADAGLTWAAGGPRWGDVFSLACAGPGRVYAGMAGGRVYRTTDGGATWDNLSGNVALTVAARTARSPHQPVELARHERDHADGGATLPEVVVTTLPATPVRALFDDGAGTLYAGTDFGAWKSGDVFASWTSVPFLAPGAAAAPSSPPSPAPPHGHPSPPHATPNPRHGKSSPPHGKWSPPHGASSPPHGVPSPPAQPPMPAVWSFARAPWGEVVAGTDAGVWSVSGTAVGTGLPALGPDLLPNVVRALYADPVTGSLLAGTDAGLYSLATAAGGWVAEENGPALYGELLPIRALADADGQLMAATPAGVCARGPAGCWSIVGTEAPPGWAPCPPASPPYGSPPAPGSSSPATGSSSPATGSSSAGTGSSSGTTGSSSATAGSSSASPPSASPPAGSPPASPPTSPPSSPPTSPPSSPPTSPPSSPPGDCGLGIPVPAPPGLNNSDVVALAAGMGVVAAASPYAGFPVEEYPGPPICDGVVYLSGLVPQVVPGSWIVLQQAPDPAGDGSVQSPPNTPPAAVAVVRVLTARTLTLERYGRSGQATEVTVEPKDGLGVFDMRYTSAFAGSRPLKLATRRLPDLVPVAGTRVKVAGAVPSLPAKRMISVSGRRIRAAVWPRAGVFARTGDQWTPAGLASVDVVAVAWAPGGVMLAAVGGDPGAAGPDAGLYASEDGGATWKPAAEKLAGKRVVALAGGSGAAWAAGPKGAVFTSVDGVNWTSAGTVPGAVTALAVDEHGNVYAATATAGVLRRAGGAWTAIRGLPRGPVRALAAVPGGGVAAGTPRGAWWLAPGAPAWKPWSQGLANRDVRALAALPGGEVLAGTSRGGVFSAPAGGEGWRAASQGLAGGGAMAIRALAAGPGGSAWAGTRGAGCFTRAAGDAAWSAAPLGAANDVRALAGGAAGVLAGCGAAPLLVAGRAAPRGSLALDPILSLDAGVAGGLDQGSLSTALRGTFRDAGVTLPRTVVVRVQTRGEAWWIAAPQGVLLLRRDAGAVRVRRPNGLATLMGPPPRSRAGMPVADSSGQGGTLTPRAGELLWQPAAASDPTVGELAAVAASSTALRSTTLTLAQPLANAYDPATVQINANLAEATHGGTQGAWPYLQVLGNGNAAVPGQSFSLPRSPLTWVPSSSDPSGRTCALDVYVNGVKWTRVDSLYTAHCWDAAYEVRVDENGAATVVFGDGVNGARLPTGMANVTAQYRVGVGPAGNLGVGRLTILRSAPLGVRTATNPVPAQGGAAGETLAQLAESGPRRARVLERVVALSDYRDYALGFPGVSQALAQPLRDPRGRAVVVVTVAGAEGPPAAGVAGELATAMAAAGARPGFRVLPCRVVEFVIRAHVQCDPNHQAPQVQADATAALQAAYGAASRRVGASVAASAVLAVLQAVDGVLGVQLLALCPAGETPSVQMVLRAAGAQVGAHGVVAAELLVPAATGGIVVRAEVAP